MSEMNLLRKVIKNQKEKKNQIDFRCQIESWYKLR